VSRQRAEAVRDFLIPNGVPADRIHAHGRGARFPLSGTPRVSPANRRIEVTTTRRRRDFPAVLPGHLQPPGTSPSPPAPRIDPAPPDRASSHRIAPRLPRRRAGASSAPSRHLRAGHRGPPPTSCTAWPTPSPAR
jgi:hypothetical protein